MSELFTVDWHALFMPTESIAEIILRGSIMYLSLFTILRLVLKRETGSLGISDILVVVLLADAAQNGMAGEYLSITEGIVLVTTIVLWSYAIDWLGYHVPRIQRFVRPPPLKLIEDGELLWENMRHELINEDELMSQLRMQGVDDVSVVKEAHMEGDGHISVVLHEEAREKREHKR